VVYQRPADAIARRLHPAFWVAAFLQAVHPAYWWQTNYSKLRVISKNLALKEKLISIIY
jgi:hypothetical protein